MDRPLTIGIVGGGTAGAAAAILLARAGHHTTVFECVAEPKPVGAGITLQPTGQRALARLGLLDAIRAAGAQIDRLTCVRRGGRVLVDLPYADIDPRLHGIGIHRGALFETLFAEARTLATVRCGATIASSVHTGDARWLVDSHGHRHGPFDLVVAADGAVCELHADAPKLRVRPYAWGALWFVADDPGGELAKPRTILQTVDGARHLLGLLPTGLAPGKRTPVVSLFWSIRGDRVDDWRRRGLVRWRDDVLRLDPRAESVLDQIDDVDRMLFSRYHDVAMRPWHADRIVFLGDAAHATSPQLGQGANLALVDAVALADAIDEHPDVARALDAYSTARRRHLAYYQFATRMLTPLFQSDARLVGWIRDRVFPISRWFGPLRRRMVRTMIGIDRGVFRRPIPLESIVRDLLAEPQASQRTAP
jgi:2-polyprenyl-6-methoxyphenol hydroxylase-like FAD-dependent oxidoreductase